MNGQTFEPALDQLLDEPIIQALMTRDNIRREDLEHLMRVARLKYQWTGHVRIPPGLVSDPVER